MGTSVDDMNRALFDALRTLDHLGLDIILAQGAPEEGVGIAYMNRLKKRHPPSFRRAPSGFSTKSDQCDKIER